jgi:hypothetical protein
MNNAKITTMSNWMRLLSFAGLLAIVLLFTQCAGEPAYYGSYYTTLDTEKGSGSTTLILNIQEESVLLGDHLCAYNVAEETGDKVFLEVMTEQQGKATKIRLTYNKTDEQLTMSGGMNDKDIVLERLESYLERKAAEFVPVELKANLDHLSDNEIRMLPLLMEAANIMDKLFWKQAYGEPDEFLSGTDHKASLTMIRNNYGPWDRLNGNQAFLPGVGPKPAGANFYPADMSQEEFNQLDAVDKTSLYTVIRRDENGNLKSVPYHIEYKEELEEAADLINQAAALCEEPGLRKYLELRSDALLSSDYLASDLTWMDMKDNKIDFVVGPIENYEDALYGYKAAFEAYILLKDLEWSKKLDRFAELLPTLQKQLPVVDEYKQEVPGSDSDLGVYDALYYAGDCNAGSKTIAINLPNDERVHEEKGSRKLQLKNSMKYKYDEILVPISEVLIDEEQRGHIQFDAFFENTMFHEVAHGLGIRNTLDGSGTVRHALREQASTLEEGKADILGLFMVTILAEMGELGQKDLMDNYVTFMAGIFRSVRFGVASSHGKANMIRFYYFQEEGAFSRNDATGTYRVDFEKMQKAMNKMASEILIIQGDGNYDAAKELVTSSGYIRGELQKDLDRLEQESIPVDIIFEQGPSILGL